MITPDRLQKARDEGYTEDEILESISDRYSSYKSKIKKARDEGYSPEEIITAFAERPAPKSSPEETESTPFIPSERDFLPAFAGGMPGAEPPISPKEAIKGTARGLLETASFVPDYAQAVEQQTSNFLDSLFGNEIDTYETANQYKFPKGRDLTNKLLGEATPGESDFANFITGATLGFSIGGPLGAAMGVAGNEMFQAANEYIDESDASDTTKEGLKTLLLYAPLIGLTKSDGAIKPEIATKNLDKQVPTIRKVTGLEELFTPQENLKPVIDAEANVLSREPLPKDVLPPEIPPEPSPQGPPENITRPGTEDLPSAPEKPSYERYRDTALEQVDPIELSRGQLANTLVEANNQNYNLARENTSQLYDIASQLGEGVNVDVQDLALETLNRLNRSREFLPSERPQARQLLLQIVDQLNIGEEATDAARNYVQIQEYLDGVIPESSLPDNLQGISNNALRQTSTALMQDLRNEVSSSTSELPVTNVIDIVKNMNRMMDFEFRDLTKKSKPTNRLKDLRSRYRNRITDINEVGEDFLDAYNAANASHRNDVRLYGNDFIQKLMNSETGTEVIARDLDKAQSASGIRTQLEILNSNNLTQNFINPFEKGVLSELFLEKNLSPDKRRSLRDILPVLSENSRNVATRIQGFRELTPLEQSLAFGFDNPTLKKMETPRGYQNTRRELLDVGGNDLLDVYNKMFTFEIVDPMYDPQTGKIKPNKLSEFKKNKDLRKSLDLANGEGFSKDLIEAEESYQALVDEWQKEKQQALDLYEAQKKRAKEELPILKERRARERRKAKKVDQIFKNNMDNILNSMEQVQAMDLSVEQKTSFFKDFLDSMGQNVTAGDLVLYYILAGKLIPYKIGKAFIQTFMKRRSVKKANQALKDLNKKVNYKNAKKFADIIDSAIKEENIPQEEFLKLFFVPDNQQ